MPALIDPESGRPSVSTYRPRPLPDPFCTPPPGPGIIDAAVTLAHAVAHARAVLDLPGMPTGVIGHMVELVDRSERSGLGLPIAEAAEFLDLSESAVRLWIDRGQLDVVPGSPSETMISCRSLGEALAAINRLRELLAAQPRLIDVVDPHPRTLLR